MPKENKFTVLGGGGLTSRVAASVSCWRRLILEGDGNVVGGGGLASNMLRRPRILEPLDLS